LDDKKGDRAMSKQIETHYRKKNGTISCGSLYGFNTSQKQHVDCPICVGNIRRENNELEMDNDSKM